MKQVGVTHLRYIVILHSKKDFIRFYLGVVYLRHHGGSLSGVEKANAGPAHAPPSASAGPRSAAVGPVPRKYALRYAEPLGCYDPIQAWDGFPSVGVQFCLIGGFQFARQGVSGAFALATSIPNPYDDVDDDATGHRNALDDRRTSCITD